MDAAAKQIKGLTEKVDSAQLPDELKSKVLSRLNQLSKLTDSPTFLPEFDRLNRYIEWIVSIPWKKRTQDNLDLEHAKKTLDKNHHGLEGIKDRILEYISVMKLNEEEGKEDEIMRAPILCFVGLVGTGKTTIAASIAETLGRKFARIPFGGMGNPLDLRGESRMKPEAEPGKVIKALRATQSKNSVILLDEIDRVTDEGRSSIMGVLVELLDPEQNSSFVDHYLDYPIDLSEVLFITTANNTHNIATAVLDRIEPIEMPSYSDAEKITIGKNYMLPKILRVSGIDENALSIDDEVWAQVVRPLGFDAGTRTLERTIQGVVRKVARKMVNEKGTTFRITPENIKELLPKQAL
jgi:ATP-dependent Lon protease